MAFQMTYLSIASVINAVIALAIAGVFFSKRMLSGANSLQILTQAIAFWSVIKALEFSNLHALDPLSWSNLGIFGMLLVSIRYFMVAFEYNRTLPWPPRSYTLFLMFLIPLVVWSVVIAHELDSDTVMFYQRLVIEKGSILSKFQFWIWVDIKGLSELLQFSGMVLFFRSFIYMKSPFRMEALILFLSFFIPWLTNVMFFAGLIPVPPTGLALFTTNLGCLMIALGVLLYRWVLIIPGMPAKWIEGMEDAILVFGRNDRLVDLNQQGSKLMDLPEQNILGDPIQKVLERWPQIVEVYRKEAVSDLEIVFQNLQGDTCRYDIHFGSLKGNKNEIIGRIISIRDMTAYVQAVRLAEKDLLEQEKQRIVYKIRGLIQDGIGRIANMLDSVRSQVVAGERVNAISQLDLLRLALNGTAQQVGHFLQQDTQLGVFLGEFTQVLGAYLGKVEAITGIHVQLGLPAQPIETILSETTCVQLFVVIQEVFDLAYRKARANQVSFYFTVSQEYVDLTIMFNCKAFEVEKIQIPDISGWKKLLTQQNGFEVVNASTAERDVSLQIRIPRLMLDQQRKALIGLRILIAVPNLLKTEGLIKLLAERGVMIKGTASTSREALEKAEKFQPDILFWDVGLPGESPDLRMQHLKLIPENIRIILLSEHANDPFLVRALQSGVDGFLLTTGTTEKFLQALIAILHGEMTVTSSLVKQLTQASSWPTSKSPALACAELIRAGLSERQIQILSLVAKGHLYKKIASDMHLSESAIKYHMDRIQVLLNCENRAQAETYARNIGLVSLAEENN